MPKFVTSPTEHSLRFNDWNRYIENMSEFEIPYSVESGMAEKEIESKSKYTRFMAFTREWIYEVVKASHRGPNSSLRKSEYDYLSTSDTYIEDGWLKKIMKVKNGKDLNFEFPTRRHRKR